MIGWPRNANTAGPGLNGMSYRDTATSMPPVLIWMPGSLIVMCRVLSIVSIARRRARSVLKRSAWPGQRQAMHPLRPRAAQLNQTRTLTPKTRMPRRSGNNVSVNNFSGSNVSGSKVGSAPLLPLLPWSGSPLRVSPWFDAPGILRRCCRKPLHSPLSSRKATRLTRRRSSMLLRLRRMTSWWMTRPSRA